MPSVLIECGFISNLNDLSSLRSASKLDEIAEGIFKAFARSVKMAVKRDIYRYELPSTKGKL